MLSPSRRANGCRPSFFLFADAEARRREALVARAEAGEAAAIAIQRSQRAQAARRGDRQRDEQRRGVQAGEAAALASQTARREQDARRDADRRTREQEAASARTRAQQPANLAERARIVEAQQRLLDEAQERQRQADTRAERARVAELERSVEVARAELRRARAEAREARMWDPAAFHRARPELLDRTLDRARADPPPREVEVMCYVPRAVAAAHGYCAAAPGAAHVDGGGGGGGGDGGDGSDGRGGGGVGGATAAANGATSGRVRVYVPADATDPYERGTSRGHPTPIRASSVRSAVATLRQQAHAGNVTWFHPCERDHPLCFWEQRVRCYFCGCDHFVLARGALHGGNAGMHLRCCRDGECMLHADHAWPKLLLQHATSGTGMHSVARLLNEEARLCAMALPAGTHRLPERGGGVRITGITYALMRNVNELSSARSFYHDPDDPSLTRDERILALQSTGAKRAFHDALEYPVRNPYYEALQAWAEEENPSCHLVLQREGTTSGLRVFRTVPGAANVHPRTALVFSRADVDDKKVVIKATNASYPLVNWPLAFPSGQPPRFADGALVDDWLNRDGREDGRNLNLQQATLMLMLQPERSDRGSDLRDAAGAFALVPTLNPYVVPFPHEGGMREPYLWRRFNRFQLLGKLGSEFLLDRWMSVMDHRRDMLSRPAMQRRLLGQMGGDGGDGGDGGGDGGGGAAADGVAADAAAAGITAGLIEPDGDGGEAAGQYGRPTYMPATEEGSPRNQYEKTGDAMYLNYVDGSPLIFATDTFDAQCTECHTRLPCFDQWWAEGWANNWEVAPRGARFDTHGWPHKEKQKAYDAPALHAEVFEYKHHAFLARLRSGTIFRNVGRPRIVGWREVPANADSPARRVPQYDFPMSIDRREDGPDGPTQGYLMSAIEYQSRCYGHGHTASRPARVPAEWSLSTAMPGQRLDWVDLLTCARLPDRSVLLQFGMLGTAGAWRVLGGVCRVPGDAQGGLWPGYEYLARSAPDAYADDECAVHPDIVHDFGARFEDPNVVLTRLTRLISGQPPRLKGCTVRIVGLTHRARWMGFCELHPSHNGREGKVICDWLDEWNDTVVVVVLVRHATDRPSDSLRREVPRAYVELVRGEPDHYSLHAYNPSVALRGGFRDESVPHTDRRGRMIHNHPKGPAIPNGQPCGGNDCTPCKKAHFPKPPSQFTTIGPDGFVLYQRGPADIMVVAWNAWVALYLESHVNIEVIVSGGNVVQYLFKLFTYIWKGAGVGDVNKAQLRHEWDCDDEVGHYFRVLETCDTEAFRRMAQMATVIFFPRIEKLIVHAPRARAMMRAHAYASASASASAHAYAYVYTAAGMFRYPR